MRQGAIRAGASTLIALQILISFQLVAAQSKLEFRELRQLGRGIVNAISWKPDATTFAAGGSQGIWLYDAGKFTPLKQLTLNETNSLRWLPDGRQIAADGPDGAVIYDANTGTTMAHFPAAMNPGESSRDGQQWAFISNDGEIQICTVQTQICVTRYTAQKLFIGPGARMGGQWWLRWSPDGKRIASDIASNLRIWNTETGKTEVSFDGEAGSTSVLDWSPDGNYLLTEDNLYSVQNDVVDIWNTTTGQLTLRLDMPDLISQAAFVAWNSDNTEFAILTMNQTYLVWDATTFALKRIFRAPGWAPDRGLGNWDRATSLEWSRRGLLGSTTASIRLWDVKAGDIIASRLDYFTVSYRAAWSPLGHRLATVHGYGQARGDNRLRVWDADTGELLCVGEGHSWAVADVAWSPDGRYIATAGGSDNTGDDSRAIVWQADTCAQVHTYDNGPFSRFAGSVSWSPDGKRLAIGSQIWDIATGKRIMSIEGYYNLLWNPHTNFAVGRSNDGKNIAIWDLDTGNLVRKFSAEPTDNDTMAWSADGLQLASSGKDAVIQLWDVATGKPIRELKGYNDQINALAFSPDGKLIAAAGGTPTNYYGTPPVNDSTIRIWDIASGEVLAVLVGHTDAIYSIAWSADGQRLASTGANNTIRIWEVRQEK